MRVLLNSNFINVCKILSRSVHLEWSPNSKTSKKIWDRYRKLPIANCKVQATYVWIDGTGQNLRAKTRTMDFIPNSHKECPTWDFDGSGTYFTDLTNSDILLCPVALYKDPVTQGSNKIVLCETYTDDGKPTKTNHRHRCMELLNKACDKDPMFGFEQEFQLMDAMNRPFGWPAMLGEPSPLTSSYCSVGADTTYGREIVECVYRCLLHLGVETSGYHADQVPSQWEVEIGPSVGIKAADDLWIARYLLQRIAEDFGVSISYNPKRFPNWAKASCHINFSTKQMREEGGYKHIEDAIKKLDSKKEEYLKMCDSHCENKSFKWGVADRSACIRISKRVALDKKGYFQDRRLAANVDPYKVISAMVSVTCQN